MTNSALPGAGSVQGSRPTRRDGARMRARVLKTKAAVSRAAESDCQTDRTRRLSAVIRRRDRSGSSRPRSERRAFTVPAAAKTINNGDLDCWASCPLSVQNERTAHPGGASEGAGLSPDVSSPLTEGPWAVLESRRDSVPEDSRVPRLPALVAGRVVRGNGKWRSREGSNLLPAV